MINEMRRNEILHSSLNGDKIEITGLKSWSLTLLYTSNNAVYTLCD